MLIYNYLWRLGRLISPLLFEIYLLLEIHYLMLDLPYILTLGDASSHFKFFPDFMHLLNLLLSKHLNNLSLLLLHILFLIAFLRRTTSTSIAVKQIFYEECEADYYDNNNADDSDYDYQLMTITITCLINRPLTCFRRRIFHILETL